MEFLTEYLKILGMIGLIKSYPNLLKTMNRTIFLMATNSAFSGEYVQIKLIKSKAKNSSRERKIWKESQFSFALI